MSHIIFIDRDGVINADPIGDYIKSWADFKFEEGALEALKKISDLRHEIIIISNQAGIGDGVYPESSLREIDSNMKALFKEKGIHLRATHYCLHGKQAGCKCRKPETGLFEQATEGLVFNKSETYFIGDKGSDMEAGKRFGLKTIFVLTGHGSLEKDRLTEAQKPDHIAKNLLDAVQYLAE